MTGPLIVLAFLAVVGGLLNLPHVLVSPGQRGMNLRLPVQGLIDVTGARVVEATDAPGPEG